MSQVSPAKKPGWLWIATLGLLAVWLGSALFVVPALIRSAYRGESFGFLNRLITGQDLHSVDRYLATWSQLAVRVTILLGGLLLLVHVAHYLDLWGRIRRGAARLQQRESELAGRPPRRSPGEYWLVLVWCGLAAGLWETVYLSKKMLLGEWLAVHQATSVTSLWTAPLGYVLIYSIPALLVLAVARRRPSWITLKWIVFGGLFIAVFSAGRSTAARLELYGLIPLAAGLALVSARLAAAWADNYMRFVKRSVPAALVLLAALAAGIELEQRMGERRDLSALPEAAAGTPNVLLIILDTVRSKSLSLYGYERPTTPELERLAQRGIVFEHAVATAPWTLPTHATVFTGRHHHELSVDWKVPLDGTFPTLAEHLRDAGFATAGFVGNFYYCGPQFGLDRGFIHYEHRPVTFVGIIESSWLGRELILQVGRAVGYHQRLPRKTAAVVNRELLDWLDGVTDERPFFAFLNYFDAHSPYLPPKPYNVRFSEKQPRYWLKDVGLEYTEAELGELTDAYDGSIAYLDDQLGELFDELERRGVLQNTLVVVTSDHGEQFGEHRLMYHSNSLYMPLLHVPLLVSFPQHLPSNVRIEEPVSVRDIAATVTDILGLSASPFPGRSIAGVWAPDAADPTESQPSVVLSEITVNRRIPDEEPAAYGPMSSLVDDRLHYIRRGDGHEELYDWIADPEELNDLARTETGRPELQRMRARLDALLQPPDPAGAASTAAASSVSSSGASSR